MAFNKIIKIKSNRKKENSFSNGQCIIVRMNFAFPHYIFSFFSFVESNNYIKSYIGRFLFSFLLSTFECMNKFSDIILYMPLEIDKHLMTVKTVVCYIIIWIMTIYHIFSINLI